MRPASLGPATAGVLRILPAIPGWPPPHLSTPAPLLGHPARALFSSEYRSALRRNPELRHEGADSPIPENALMQAWFLDRSSKMPNRGALPPDRAKAHLADP